MAPRTRSRVIRPPHIRPGDDDDRTCPVCDRWFQTSQGLMSHLSLARSCKWYRKGKNPIRLDEDIPEPVEMDELVVGNDNPLNGIEVHDEDFEDVMLNRSVDACRAAGDLPADRGDHMEPALRVTGVSHA